MNFCRNLTNQRFGILVAKSCLGRYKAKLQWLCMCDCGNITTVAAGNLASGNTLSCGCLFKGRNYRIHGQSNSIEFKLLHAAKYRAKLQNLPFDLKLEDIIVPAICPVLGTPLVCNKHHISNNSPTLDRVVPQKGYLKDNISVISHRANFLKNNGTLEEFKAITRYLEGFNCVG